MLRYDSINFFSINFLARFGPKWAQIGPKKGFFAILLFDLFGCCLTKLRNFNVRTKFSGFSCYVWKYLLKEVGPPNYCLLLMFSDTIFWKSVKTFLLLIYRNYLNEHQSARLIFVISEGALIRRVRSFKPRRSLDSFTVW